MTPEDTLAEIAPQIGRMVRSRAKDAPHLWEDLTQEAMIAAWQEFEKDPGAPVAHAIRSAQIRVSKITGQGKPFTGEPRHPGREDAHDTSGPLVRTSADGEEYLVVEPEDLATEKALALVEDPTVGERVRAAVAGLNETEREYVFLRFWAGMDPTSRVPEIRARLKEFPVLARSGVWDRARVKLRASLAEVTA